MMASRVGMLPARFDRMVVGIPGRRHQHGAVDAGFVHFSQHVILVEDGLLAMMDVRRNDPTCDP